MISFPVFFRLAHLALQKVSKGYVVFSYFQNSVAKSDQKPKTKNGMNKIIIDRLYIKLGFRLWPNGTEVSRYIENDITLSSYTIPSGTHVDLNPSVHFRNPDHFPEPDKNIPERWLRKDEASEFKDLDLDLDKINKLIDAAEKVRICKICL